MLLMLMLAVAVMTIMALRVAQSYRHRIQRDREVEMIHRGVQYARAVKRYYRKFGVYPTSIEQLEETNKIRFLRKRYKDPMTADGKWKIAHLNDIKLPGVEGLMAAPKGTGAATSTTSQTATIQPGSPSQTTGTLADSTKNTPEEQTQGGATVRGGADSSGNSEAVAPSAAGSASGSETAASSSSSSTSAFGGEVLGPMLGVMSKSHRIGIHSFNDKSHYDEWYFIYAPVQDHGQLITGPFNPSLTGMSAVGTSASGQTGSATTPSSTTTAPGSATGSNLSTPHP
jgi:hypothetical protein